MGSVYKWEASTNEKRLHMPRILLTAAAQRGDPDGASAPNWPAGPAEYGRGALPNTAPRPSALPNVAFALANMAAPSSRPAQSRRSTGPRRARGRASRGRPPTCRIGKGDGRIRKATDLPY
eukprot:6253084-Prymnesium_polylepis.1